MKSIEIRIEDGESLLDALKRTVFESNEEDARVLYDTVIDMMDWQ